MRIKRFEKITLEDPYGEENWDEKSIYEIPLYLSEDQPKVYQDGTPLQRPWVGKNLVLFEKNDKYYILGEIRYSGSGNFFMFYEENQDIERKRLKEFKGKIIRELNNEEKTKVIDALSHNFRMGRNFGETEKYMDILNALINEDFLFTDKYPESRVLRFAEYRKGSSEYGQLFQDLMMILRLKKDQNKEADEIILTREDLKNIDFHKLTQLANNTKKMRKLGMSFDMEILGDKVRVFNLNKVNKDSRPWENIDIK